MGPWMRRWFTLQLRSVSSPSLSSSLSRSAFRGSEPRRNNPPPTVRADQGNGVFLLTHREPQGPCPVDGGGGTLLFPHRGSHEITRIGGGTLV
jgi:hypothetical protein